MINRSHKQFSTPSFIPKFSDPDIIHSLIDPGFWRPVFLGERRAAWLFIKGITLLKIEMFAAPLRSVLRYRHGKRTVGMIITLMSCLMMIAFNTTYMVGYLATFFPLAAPVLLFVLETDHMIAAAFTAIKSSALLYFWIGYLGLSVIHLIIMFRTGHQVPTSRGTSILHVLIFRHLKVSQTIVQRFIEPGLVGALGYGLCVSGTDFTFGLFLMIAASCLFVQECYQAIMSFLMNR